MPFVSADDGAQIFYKDWGSGPPVILSHGWPLNADAWDAAARFLAEHGHRVIAHDRRGHGRSTQTWHGNEMDTYADDLATPHRGARPERPHPGRALDGWRRDRPLRRSARQRPGGEARARVGRAAAHAADRRQPRGPADRRSSTGSGPARPRTAPSCTATSPTAPSSATTATSDVDQGFRDAFWLQGMACGHRAAYECIAAFSATDFRPDLAAVDVPTLVIHGDDDQIVPFEVGGKRSAELIAGAVLKVYEGSGHALPDTDRDRLHADLLAFIDS